MESEIRQAVHIPDHEVLRKVGGGAYGEVWLARGVTGAWRAVKVVWREDFEDERGFEREFDGILQYEPISRDHPALVNVLHVGRSKEGGETFYYYVMELGDDFNTGVEINAVEYEARTLRSDLVMAESKPLDLDFCLDVAVRLSDALAYLHERGLAHRDVKPANVIFVGGKAKLADIGLVAPRDQRTFVGTEGFVPPEGPGSSQADLYSLGKVLYEMMTGRDRLQFPELPEEIPHGEKRKLWLEMNQVICDICEPKLSKRRITSASELSAVVKRLQQGKKLRKLRFLMLGKALIVLLLFALVSSALAYFKPWQRVSQNTEKPVVEVEPVDVESSRPKNEVCSIKVHTSPPYALVFENGVLLEQVTPTEFRDFKPGDLVTYRFQLDGYKDFEKSYTVPDQAIWMIDAQMQIYRPPVANQVWVDPVGAEYLPRDGYHISGFVSAERYTQFLKAKKVSEEPKMVSFSESGDLVDIVLLNEEMAKSYLQWLEGKSRKEGLLTEEQMLTFEQDADLIVTGFTEAEKSAGLLPTRCVAKTIPYATVKVTSEPKGARVFVNEEWVGVTPMSLERLRPGGLQVELRADGFKKFSKELVLTDNESKQLEVQMKPNDGVIFSTQWKNSLGLPMVPIRKGLMGSAWETRVVDYAEFVKATKHRKPKKPGFRQTPNDPVVGVSREDAIAFCKWLTQKERAEERISETHRYKIPSDLEWSELAGLNEAPEATPSERDHRAQKNRDLSNLYFWGDEFPPSKVVANVAGETAALAVAVSKSRTIDGYDDTFGETSPVGSFPASSNGLYDLCGNVYEWVDTDYNDTTKYAVVRGGSWASFTKNHLRVWSRFLISKSLRDNQFGFRVVLVDESENK